jgi:phosphoglycolate phosphatase-like HAD superfamily hydrolase
VKRGEPGSNLVVFDLDSTLFDLTQRVTAILERFAADPAVRARFPEDCERMRAIKINRSDWGLIEPLERIGITKTNSPDFVRAVQAAWVEGFFSNDFLDRDFPLPGAVAFVEACLERDADVMYLTGRDVARMGEGTEKSLRQWGFPLDHERVTLTLKPTKELDDAEFKADVIEALRHRYEHIWLFENEPVNINIVLRRTPHVKIVYVETCHSGLDTVKDPFATVEHFDFSISDLE